MEDEWLTTREIANQYGITTAAVWMSIRRDRIIQGIECRKRGRDWEVRREVVERLWGKKEE